MCGIAGKISFSSRRVTLSDLNLLSAAIAHRGPDDSGCFLSPNRRLGLAHRRLSVIDLSSAGHQPMSYRHRYWIVFNGEIYNFQELKNRLTGLGHRFRSRTDTEVILALYAQYGSACLRYLRGMFSFAIFDSKHQTLFLARDRLGKKPLKYFHSLSTFIFASELKALLTQPEVKKTPDPIAIDNYLTYGYVPAPRTGFLGLSKLEPAHYLLLDLATGRLSKHRYWQPDYSSKLHLSETEWSRRILSELETAVRLRLISDVPVGLFLSGGSDSSIIAAFMAQASPRPINTFTISFAEKKYDEPAYADTVPRRFGTNHTVFTVRPQALSLLPQLARQFEEPFADSSAVITYLISRLARSHVKVVLNGDGGDENFAGYDRYLKLNRDIFLSSLLPFLSPLSPPLSRIWPRFGRFWTGLYSGWPEKFITYNSIYLCPEKSRLYTPGFLDRLGSLHAPSVYLDKMSAAPVTDTADRALYADLTTYFPDDLLAKIDIASMSVGLESRSPLADHRLVELACRIPFNLKIRRHTLKYLYKKTLLGLLPPEIIYRPKMGFSIPLSPWFSGRLNSYTRGLLLSRKSVIRSLFRQDFIRHMLNSHSAENDFGPRLYSLLMLELWFQQYFD